MSAKESRLVYTRRGEKYWPYADRFQPYAEVVTMADNGAEDWDRPRSARWGVQGTVIDRSDAHGLCYCVRHRDDSMGWYAPNELELADGGNEACINNARTERVYHPVHYQLEARLHTTKTGAGKK
jgi:hypothetical protein